MDDARLWAIEEFGRAQLGDIRRRDRLVRMAERAVQAPGGRLTEVFTTSAERQGAYDLLDNEEVTPSALTEAMGRAAAVRCASFDRVFVVVDGSSVTLTDKAGDKDFGAIGTFTLGARGLKVLTALAVAPDGAPVGVLDQQYWVRTSQQRTPAVKRDVCDKETQRWLDAVTASVERLRTEAPSTKPCIVIDREGDNQHILSALKTAEIDFIIRSSFDRRLLDGESLAEVASADRVYLRDVLAETKAFEVYDVPIKGGPGRKARLARMQLRARKVDLRLRNQITNTARPLGLWVVEVKETKAPQGSKPIVWRLLTSMPVLTAEAAHFVVNVYARRWRIEEFHKTWKSSLCDVETSLLRSKAHAQKWVSILAAVAARAERLKVLSRSLAPIPAARELHPLELRALLMLKLKNKRSNERISMRMRPSLQTAVVWIAELGGYTGASSGGPPGTITITRGLEKVRGGAEVLQILVSQGKLR